jgi:hypothetical protein
MRLKRNYPVNILLIIFFTLLGFAVMGYHPGLEDDGIYLAAVKARLNPALYPHNAEFFRLQMQASVFDALVAGFARWSAIPLAVAELLLQIASIMLIVCGCRLIAQRLFSETRAQWAGVAMATAMFTLPVAGTALYIVDQHLHPRSIATGFILLAVWRILSGKRWQALPLLLAAFLLHPIMAVMGSSFCFFLTIAMLEEKGGWRRFIPNTGGGWAASFVPLGWVFAPSTPAWHEAVNLHCSLSLYRWAWYEWIGAVAPLLLFWLIWRIARRRGERMLERFALAVFFYGIFQLAVAMILLGIPSLNRVTPLQPMRFLHLVYLFMALVSGCLLGKYLLKASIWRWAVYLAAINGGMFLSQQILFNASEHLELPGQPTENSWVQALDWIRLNTPTEAYFALDPEYLAAPGEDYHGFRALAERSQLADEIKDSAVVAQVPALAETWERQVKAEQGWRHFQIADFERLKVEFGVDWVLIAYPEATGLDCRWHNGALAVCRIP